MGMILLSPRLRDRQTEGRLGRAFSALAVRRAAPRNPSCAWACASATPSPITRLGVNDCHNALHHLIQIVDIAAQTEACVQKSLWVQPVATHGLQRITALRTRSHPGDRCPLRRCWMWRRGHPPRPPAKPYSATCTPGSF